MDTKKLIYIVLACVLLVGAFLGGIVTMHERQNFEVPSKEVHTELNPASSTGAKPAELGSGSGALDPKVSLERRLRMFAIAGRVQRGKIVHSIREKLPLFRPHLIHILQKDDSGLLEPALLVTGRLGLEGVEPHLFGRIDAGPSRIRAAAIRALGYMRRWMREDAVRILSSKSDGTVLRAALEASVLLEEPPIRSILPLLQHSDWGVVQAAQRAMPAEMSEKDVTWVSEWTRGAEPAAAIIGIEVLGGLDPTPFRDRILVEHTTSKVWSVQLSCLDALARDAGTVADTKPIWSILEDPKGSLEIKVRAFLVLEKTLTVDVERIRGQIASYHPVVRLAAARCLLVKAERDGIRTLIDLLSTVEGPQVDDEDRSCAIEGAHELLVEVSKQDHRPDPATWDRWYRTDGVKLGSAIGHAIATPPRLSW